MKHLIYIVLSLVMIGCGGGGSGSSSSTTSVETLILNGTIDSVEPTRSSFVVNGHTIDGSNARVSYSIDSLSFDDLIPGMIVSTYVSNDSAETIRLEPIASGQISALSTSSVTLNGLVFEYSSTGLIVGDSVMVFGLLQPDQTWKVSAIAKIDGIVTAEIEGSITNLDATNGTFTLAGVTVDFSNASIENNLQLSNGNWVEVYGQFVSGQFVAAEVEFHDENLDGTEIEGIVTWVSDDKSWFEIGGFLQIQVNASTVFDDGSISNLISGAIVEVDLTESNGSLVASKVDFESQLPGEWNNEFKVEGEASVSNGALSINNFSFEVDSNTEFDDGLSIDNVAGQWVEVDGKAINGTHYVKEVKLETKDSQINLEGSVESNSLWGYTASDNSLVPFNGLWVEVECNRSASNELTQCQLDID